MYACQWHLTVPFGKQKDALDIVTAWAKEGFNHPDVLVKPVSMRFMVGHIGPSPSHIICEYVFKTIEDFHVSHRVMTSEPLKKYSHAIAPLIAAGSQHWEILRIVE
jgi:hypothetical protein